MFLLDTNVVSELRRAAVGRADTKVAAWFVGIDPDRAYLCSMTLREIELGILQMERRDASQGAVLRAWMSHRVLPEFSGRILPMDEAVAFRCAALHLQRTRPERDAWIAATALVHGLTMVTRNTADFEGTGLTLLNPWLSL